MLKMDLNCDAGESFGVYHLGDDAALLKYVTSANLACGFHAGDPSVLRLTVRLAKDAHVAIGAHPGLPDLVGFGRRPMSLSAAEIEDLVLYQIAATVGVVQAEGTTVRHVKPHGALYNMAAVDHGPAEAIVRAIVALDPTLCLYAPPGSALIEVGRSVGLHVVAEAFIDRAYEADGSLTPRRVPGALITDPGTAAERAVQLATKGKVRARTGEILSVAPESLCIHGDSPGAVELACAVRSALLAAGVSVCPPA